MKSLLSKLFAGKPIAGKVVRQRARISIESLEDRTVPSGFGMDSAFAAATGRTLTSSGANATYAAATGRTVLASHTPVNTTYATATGNTVLANGNNVNTSYAEATGRTVLANGNPVHTTYANATGNTVLSNGESVNKPQAAATGRTVLAGGNSVNSTYATATGRTVLSGGSKANTTFATATGRTTVGGFGSPSSLTAAGREAQLRAASSASNLAEATGRTTTTASAQPNLVKPSNPVKNPVSNPVTNPFYSSQGGTIPVSAYDQAMMQMAGYGSVYNWGQVYQQATPMYPTHDSMFSFSGLGTLASKSGLNVGGLGNAATSTLGNIMGQTAKTVGGAVQAASKALTPAPRTMNVVPNLPLNLSTGGMFGSVTSGLNFGNLPLKNTAAGAIKSLQPAMSGLTSVLQNIANGLGNLGAPMTPRR